MLGQKTLIVISLLVLIEISAVALALEYLVFFHFLLEIMLQLMHCKKAAEDKNPDHVLYAELGAGSGRKGPKSEPMESNYAQVKVDEMGYPARGPASDMSEPPQYPTSINRDRSRRHSPPPHYGGLDDDDGVIV